MTDKRSVNDGVPVAAESGNNANLRTRIANAIDGMWLQQDADRWEIADALIRELQLTQFDKYYNAAYCRYITGWVDNV